MAPDDGSPNPKPQALPMLRAMDPTGWWLIRHPDHARLAGEFAAHWGNRLFHAPEPRPDVLEGIRRHDDGWAGRDAQPFLTRQGKPSAFGADLVGRYTAFEEIDLPEYLAVRGRALETVAAENPYAAILISLHTCNLLTEHADRSTIRPDQLPLLDAFVEGQRRRQGALRGACLALGTFQPRDLAPGTLDAHFRLLQACDNLSLLACVDFEGPATLLHPLPTRDGGLGTVDVQRLGPRTFRLTPWPLDVPVLRCSIPARHVAGHVFDDVQRLRDLHAAAPEASLEVVVTRD